LEKSPWLLKGLMVSIAFPMIANEVGWVTAEMGRQPWVVYGLLRTVDGVSKSISAGQVLTSIIMFLVIYVFLFALFLFLLDKKIKEGPESHAEGDSVYRDQL
ncbi:MAG TPA: cytochrome ubiquinol oxidase subunit I, partial [Rhabdochlamydiaceae bacterium]